MAGAQHPQADVEDLVEPALASAGSAGMVWLRQTDMFLVKSIFARPLAVTLLASAG